MACGTRDPADCVTRTHTPPTHRGDWPDVANWTRMHVWLLALLAAITLAAQDSAEDFKVYTEYPRLLLKQQRLRLLRRERERQSPRWTQLETLIKGKAQ